MTPVTLGGYPAKQCARRIHNQYAPGTPEPLPATPDVQALWDAGRVFETEVTDAFRDAYPTHQQLLVLDDDAGWEQNQQSTMAGMNARLAVIIGGRLPSANGRAGAPDVLIRHLDGYLPVDIKNHKTLSPSKDPDSPAARSRVEVSTLAVPDQRELCRGYGNKGARWRDDVMQLAHYTRMLQELGCHSGPNVGGIIGTSDFTPLVGDGLGITWYDLDTEEVETYSAAAPNHRKKRSALQRYDHEFTFRIKVAAAARTGVELVRPYRIGECDTCEWFAYCPTVAGAHDASFAIETGHLKVREWQYLYDNCGQDGMLSVTQLAGVDPTTHHSGFADQSVGTQSPKSRLTNVIKRAEMTVRGVDFEPYGSPPPEVPCADIEVDFDIEWDTAGRIYQWGLRIRDGQDDATARYEPILSFEPLDEAAEAALAEQFAERIRGLRSEAEQHGKSLCIFHWHHPEVSRTKKFAPVKAALEGLTRDLMDWFNTHYFARTSSSIKEVAVLFGFTWGVDDAGGQASMRMIELARGTGPEADEARRWCLRYNESDVAAQAAIRDGLRRYSGVQ